MSKCQDKRKFRRFCQAVHAADQYMEEMALVLKPMVPYRCSKHRCFHIGHDSWMSEDRIQQFTVSSRQRAQLTRITERVALEGILHGEEPYHLEGDRKVHTLGLNRSKRRRHFSEVRPNLLS